MSIYVYKWHNVQTTLWGDKREYVNPYTKFPQLDVWASVSRLCDACPASKRAQGSFWRRHLNWIEVLEGVKIIFKKRCYLCSIHIPQLYWVLSLQSQSWYSTVVNHLPSLGKTKLLVTSTETTPLQLRLHSPAINLIL